MVYKECKQPMDKLEDLLPGIEQFLSNVLANEKLSPFAEEQRQYFLERLDIIKLPPSIPPRPRPNSLGQQLCPSSPHSNRDSHRTSSDQDDFAAYQRELSRAQLEAGTSPDITEAKVYDDIDLSTIDFSSPNVKVTQCTEDEESVYEIPKLRKTTSDSGYEKAKEVAASYDEQPVILSAGTPRPPPLPPRKERQRFDFRIRSSSTSLLDDSPGDLGKTSDLGRPSDICRPSDLGRPDDLAKPGDLSDVSFERNSNISRDGLDGYDGDSVDSLEDLSCSSVPTKPPGQQIKLPRSTRSRVRAQLGKSMSSLVDVTTPFCSLDDVAISGELQYRSKLTWTKKMVAVTNGRLVGYKMDRLDMRPTFMMLLTGYRASSHKREGRRSYEIHLDHDNFEQHVFLVDFKEWAELWCQHLNAAAEGSKAKGPVLHLTRDSLIDKTDPSTYSLSKVPAGIAGSNLSLVSTDSDVGKDRRRDHSTNRSSRKKAISQFFDALGKRSSVKKSAVSSLDSTHNHVANMTGSTQQTGSLPRPVSEGSQSSLEVTSPLTPESGFLDMPMEIPLREKHIKHQGYLSIFSNFNKRKWGKRWCMVHENNFECYRSPTSSVCELEFLLRDCVLRRAIEETKSELGLMLLENNKEKITIEPLSWSELGSWLRVLMKETSTESTPDGLQGYMDDSHPYHEAVEITWTRVHNTNNMVNSQEPLKASNRDSGIASSESSDGRFGSLERTPKTIVHKDFSDSSLPRVSVIDTGAIYTQVRKSSTTGSDIQQVGSSKTVGNQKETENLSMGDNSDPINCNNKNSNRDCDASDFDFESEMPVKFNHLEREESLVDEIMFHINSKINSPFSTDLDFSFTLDDSSMTNCNNDNKTLCLESNNLSQVTNAHDEPSAGANGIARNIPGAGRETRREVHTWDVNSEDTLSEMRTRLVQLKQDRISIRDRRDKVSSEVDRQFLTAEFDRLDRECKKLDEEIKMFEQDQSQNRRQECHKKLAGMASVREEDEVDELVQLMQQVNLTALSEEFKPEKDEEGKDKSGDTNVEGIGLSGDNVECKYQSGDNSCLNGKDQSCDNLKVKDQSGANVECINQSVHNLEGTDQSGDTDVAGINKSGDDVKGLDQSGSKVVGFDQPGDNTVQGLDQASNNAKNGNYVFVISENEGNQECCGFEETKSNSDIEATVANGIGDTSEDVDNSMKFNTKVTEGCMNRSKNQNNVAEENENVCECSDPVSTFIDKMHII
ncbi:uncharacterized protein LOC127842029 isoform X2 [Dreissena polymorpha]|nr:uncharacterized protein LOC127842029 isoform X2 [Dreissena polymorpha]